MSPLITEELNQKQFRNPHQQAQLNIIYTSGWLQNQHMLIFKKYGLSHQQYNVLRILRGALPEALSLGSIKARMLDRMSDTSRIVERLRKSGLLKRAINTTDRRVAKITISSKGLELLESMAAEESNLDSISKALSEEELQQLSSLLDKLRHQ
jgi:DNA-binding MarR family transcriptional regulator